MVGLEDPATPCVVQRTEGRSGLVVQGLGSGTDVTATVALLSTSAGKRGGGSRRRHRRGSHLKGVVPTDPGSEATHMVGFFQHREYP